MGVTVYLVYAIAALAPILLYLIKRRLSYWRNRGIAHEEPTLLQGNYTGLFQQQNFYDIFKRLYEKFKGSGPFCGVYALQRPGVLLLDLELVKRVLIKDFSNFVDRGLYVNEKDDPLSGHLFLVDGDKWRKLRSKLSSTFTSGKMKFMLPNIIQVAEEFVNVFAEMVQRSDTVEIRELLARFTTDVIGTCAFGIECNSLKDPAAEFRVMGQKSFSDTPHPLLFGFMNSFPSVARKLHMRSVKQYITDFFIKIVRENVDYRRQHNVRRNDFVDILIEMSKNKATALSIEEMAAQAYVFFLGGFETSSTTMGWALYEMSVNQAIQDKLRDEVQQVLAKSGKEFTYECMHDMTYMDQVMNETLRKYSIVPMLNRQAMEDYPVPGHPNYVISKGMPVFVSVIGIHHDPEFYPEPERFDPERFSAEQVAQRDPMTFLGFGDGPRNCIGARFGQMQTRVGLAYLLKNFKFSLCKDTEMPPKRDISQIVTSPKNGIRLKVERI